MLIAGGIITGGMVIVDVAPITIGRITIGIGSLAPHPGAIKNIVTFDPEGQFAETIALINESVNKMEIDAEILNTETKQELSVILAFFGYSDSKHNSNNNHSNNTVNTENNSSVSNSNSSSNRYMPSLNSPDFYYDRKYHKWRRVPINKYR